MSEYVDLLPVIVEREAAVLPAGFDTWGVKSVRPDLRTRGGYRWPFPGGVAVASAWDGTNKGSCPARDGDGLCVATTWAGMASGQIPASTLLLVATRSDDCVSDTAGKTRHREVAVVALVDGERLLRERGARADLHGAYLRGANLHGANLRGADLGNRTICSYPLTTSDADALKARGALL